MKKTTVMMIILLFITAGALATAAWALFFRQSQAPLPLDYAPVAVESNAEKIPNDNAELTESDDGGGFVSLLYSDEMTVDLAQKCVFLQFGNPGSSNQDAVLQILLEDQVIVQSGRLTPGKQVTKLDISNEVIAILSSGIYNGELQIAYYDHQNAEKAMINTVLPVLITVE